MMLTERQIMDQWQEVYDEGNRKARVWSERAWWRAGLALGFAAGFLVGLVF